MGYLRHFCVPFLCRRFTLIYLPVDSKFLPHNSQVTWGFSEIQDGVLKTSVELKQEHGLIIRNAEDFGVTPLGGDGLYSMKPNLKLSVKVADCAPILMHSTLTNGTPWIGAFHAGWRGATQGILREACRNLYRLGGTPESTFWSIGPCIGVCHFEVGNEVFKAAERDHAWSSKYGKFSGVKGYFNLREFLTLQAYDEGLMEKNNFSVNLCTFCNPKRFYSYRRGDIALRQFGQIEFRL